MVDLKSKNWRELIRPKRIDIDHTRAMVHSALSGKLKNVTYKTDPLFHLDVPTSCPGIDNNEILSPRNTWNDKDAYDKRAKKLASEFSEHFDKAYDGKGISEYVRAQCPGK